MHELSIAQGILDIVRDEAKRNAIERISVVRLKLGKLTAVEPSSLSFCFELITKGTLAEGAKLEIEPVPITGRCAQCGREFTLEDPFCNCPGCRSLKIDILTGREFYICEIETDD
ncbi:MAG: hydrogenase maturation nickel metallochaperone HypA [Thermodesulfobacteriota bacterium]